MKRSHSVSIVPRAAIGIGVLVLAAVMAAIGVLPRSLVVTYMGLSALSFLFYGWDKSAAAGGRSRIPEMTLHTIDLLGGWPGGLVGQQVFRHKTTKQPFKAVFGVTAGVNIVVCAWLVRSGMAAATANSLFG